MTAAGRGERGDFRRISESMSAIDPRATRGWKGAFAAAVLVLLLVSVFLLPPGALAAPDDDFVRIAFSKDSCWYRPGDTMRVRVTLDNLTRRTVRGVSVRLRVHVPNSSRKDLDACLASKPRRSYKQTDTYGPFTLSSGNNVFELEQELAKSRYSNGVYPMTVEAVRSGDLLASAVSQAVVMSFEDSTGDFEPLRMAWMFDTLQAPHRGPDGSFTSSALARDCALSGERQGWYPTLLSEMEKWQNMSFSVLLSPLLMEELRVMSEGFVVSDGRGERRFPADSREAQDASVVLSGFSRLAQSPRYQLLPGPYASPDLERMVALGWSSDAIRQFSHGHAVLEDALDAPIASDYCCPPGRRINSDALEKLGDSLGGNMVLSPLLLERSREGRRLIREGSTLCSPVKISNGEDEEDEEARLAMFPDSRMEKLLTLVSGSGDPHGVAQCIISELTNLYLEDPDRVRSCVIVSPGSWHPDADVLGELLKALDGAPWLQSVTLSEAMSSVEPVDGDPLEIPEDRSVAEVDEYTRQIERAREMYEDYRSAVLPGNRNLEPLLTDLYVSQSDVWRQYERQIDGHDYSGWVIDKVARELAKVEMPAVGNITLTSTSAKVPLSVVNATGYRVKAKLVCVSNGLAFPEGASREILLEPKENLLEVPVRVRKKGRVRFTARLESNRTVLSQLDFSVLTSRFNSFAMALVAGLLALIGLFWVWKAASRRKVGKHKRRQVKQASGEAGKASI